jgi:hypothetical protein
MNWVVVPWHGHPVNHAQDARATFNCITTHELHWSLRLSNATVPILVAELADKFTTLNNYLLALDKA